MDYECYDDVLQLSQLFTTEERLRNDLLAVFGSWLVASAFYLLVSDDFCAQLLFCRDLACPITALLLHPTSTGGLVYAVPIIGNASLGTEIGRAHV